MPGPSRLWPRRPRFEPTDHDREPSAATLQANSSCRKNRTVRFSYVDAAGTTALTETAVTGPNGDYSATLPKPTTTGPASVTLMADRGPRRSARTRAPRRARRRATRRARPRSSTASSVTGQTVLTVDLTRTTQSERPAYRGPLVGSGAGSSPPVDDCLFCGIVAGDVPSQTIDSDEQHRRVHGHQPGDAAGTPWWFPRAHSADLIEIAARGPEATTLAAQRLAKRMEEVLKPDGINLLNSCGAGRLADGLPLPLHVIPRYEDDPLKLPWIPRPGDPDEIAEVADETEELMAEMAETQPVRLERDGNVAVIVLDNPPLNLFGDRRLAGARRLHRRDRGLRRAGRSSGAPRATSSPAASTSTASSRWSTRAARTGPSARC